MAEYGIGITTYRNKKAENLNKTAFNYEKAGRHLDSAKSINNTIRQEIDWSTTTGYQGYPALGVYEGGQEPAAHLYINTKGNISPALLKGLEAFRDKAKQDSILLYRITQKGRPVIHIQLPKGVVNLAKIQADIAKASNGEVGGFVTYIYALKRLVMVNVKEFDGLTISEFMSHMPAINKVARKYNATMELKHAQVKII